MSKKRMLQPDQSQTLSTRLKQAKTDSKTSSLVSVPTTTPTTLQQLTEINRNAPPIDHVDTPNTKLTGHSAGILALNYSSDGQYLCSGGMDRTGMIWDPKGKENEVTVGYLSGHEGAIFDLCWTYDDDNIITCSSDNTCMVWDVETQKRIKKINNYNNLQVNSVNTVRRGEPLFCTGSDSGLVLIHDMRTLKTPVACFKHQSPITSVCFTDDGTQFFAGGLANEICCWDIRAAKKNYSLRGHSNTITSISLSRDGTRLLSNSMDNTLNIWDIQPYISSSSTNNRLINTYIGQQHDFQQHLLGCSWSYNDTMISCGSADGIVNIWDVDSCNIIYKLPGHNGVVTKSVFHPYHNIISSCSIDQSIIIGGIEQ